MAFTIQQLLTPQTTAQFRAGMVSALVALGIPADKWAPGGVASSILTIAASTLATLSTLLSDSISDFFLPTASGGGLQLLAQYVYGIDPRVFGATFATGRETLTNSGGGVYVVAAGQFIVSNPTTGINYANVSGFTLNASSSITIDISALTIGTVGNSNPGTITNVITPLTGVTVTNANSVVGRDTLTDAQIRTLCLNSLGARSVRGPRTAYAYAVSVAVNPITLAPVDVNRSTVSVASHTGDVFVYIASPAGAVSSSDLTGVENSIEAIARPDGVTVSVIGAIPISYVTALTIWCTVSSPGVTAAAVQTAAATAITDFFTNYPIGGLQALDDQTSPPPPAQGLFGDAIVGAVAAAILPVGATLVSMQGAVDMSMVDVDVATDGVTSITVRVLTAST